MATARDRAPRGADGFRDDDGERQQLEGPKQRPETAAPAAVVDEIVESRAARRHRLALASCVRRFRDGSLLDVDIDGSFADAAFLAGRDGWSTRMAPHVAFTRSTPTTRRSLASWYRQVAVFTVGAPRAAR